MAKRKNDEPEAKLTLIKIVTRDEILEAIPGSHGILTTIAGRLGISRPTLDRKLKEFDLIHAVAQEREGFVDFAESKLYKAVEDEEPWAVMFTLNNIARGRGYGYIKDQKGGTLEVTWNEEKTYELPEAKSKPRKSKKRTA